MKNPFRKIKRIFHPLFWLDLRYNLSCKFRSHQRWLVKEIPRGFSTFEDINKTINFKMFFYLVEEIQIENLYTWDSSEEFKALKKIIDETYKILKQDIPKLEEEKTVLLKKEVETYPDVKARVSSMFDEHIENGKKFYTIKESEHTRKMTRLNKEINELQNKALVHIAEIMPYMNVVSEDGRKKSKNLLALSV